MAMIVDYTHSENASIEEKFKSLRDSIQVALNGMETERAYSERSSSISSFASSKKASGGVTNFEDIDGDVSADGDIKAGRFLNSAGNEIGQIYTASGSNISLTADTSSYKNGCSITLPAGSYIARGQWNFDTRASGSSTYGRRTNIYNSTSSATLANNISVNTARNAQYMEVVAIFKIENQSTISLRGSTSDAGTDSCQMQIIRIA